VEEGRTGMPASLPPAYVRKRRGVRRMLRVQVERKKKRIQNTEA
jgi:hypothetical protein